MVVNFANYDAHERPILILKNAGGTSLGVIGNATDVKADIRFNETSTLEFTVPFAVDGIETPFYDDISGLRVVELLGIGRFILVNPTETGDGVQRSKKCKAYSLEYEFAFKKISLPKDTYNLWNPAVPDNTLLQIILELMPSWSVGYVSPTLYNKWRTFEIQNENLYNLIKGTAQQSYNCIFDFDTMDRLINVLDVSVDADTAEVYISTENLAKSIEISEDTENIFTRLDINGADGVDIRDVNPDGTNKIINLDYYMNTQNFSQSIINKYNAWKETYEESRQPYYILSVEYSMEVVRKVTEEAKLSDLKHELVGLENVQGVTIQAIAQNLSSQSALDECNANIASKQAEIVAKENEISAIESTISDIFSQLYDIRDECDFESYFTADEYLQIDRYIRDGEISESSFVISEYESFNGDNVSETLINALVEVQCDDYESIGEYSNKTIYDIGGGSIEIGESLSVSIISAVLEISTGNKALMTARVSSGTYDDLRFNNACISVIGSVSNVAPGSGLITFTATSAYLYLTFDTSEYEKMSVSWDLYRYGVENIEKLSQPAYTFKVESANFFSIEEFESFRNSIELGKKIYIARDDGVVLKPICIGVELSYDDPSSINMLFGDKYVSSDSTFRLVDLLNQSVSMGKNVELSKYAYSAFVDSGAKESIKGIISSALDVAKNAIMSSSEQAISWDGSGIRLRKWTSSSHSQYDNEQIWMVNNSIVMTSDGWQTAEMAIGKFYDENLGACWGIVAPRIVGTMIAGSDLVIESELKDGGISTFRVDADGCRLYNSQFEVHNDTSHIVLSPDLGIALGAYPVYTTSSGVKTLNANNAKFWVDTDGNLHFKGTLHGTDGEFTGSVVATSLTIRKNGADVSADDYIDSRVEDITDVITGDLGDLVDAVTAKTTTFYGSTQPSSANANDIWYDTANGRIKRYSGSAWVDITTNALKAALDAASDAQSTADSKIRTFAQQTQPSNLTASDVGDLWIDTDDNNKLYRWSGYSWVAYRDGTIQSIANGETGIYFANSSVGSVSLNNSVGLKIIGTDNAYFQAKNNAMGFFKNDGTAMLYYQNGNMVLSGVIQAAGGYIGGSGGWVIGNNCIYNGSASALGASGGIFMGNSGISVGSAIIMKPDGTFIIRGDSVNDDDSNYVLKIVPEETIEEDSEYASDTVYHMYLGNITFDDSFVLPVEHGGTGGIDRNSIGNMVGYYRVMNTDDIDNIENPMNGDLCALYSEGQEGASISGTRGSVTIRTWDSFKPSSAKWGECSQAYWQVSSLASESVSTSYARVGVGSSPSGACAVRIPMSITVTNAPNGISSVTVKFSANNKPSGATRDIPSKLESSVKVSLCNSSGVIYGTTTFKPNSTVSNTLRSYTVTITCSTPVTTGSYYIAFHTRTTKTLTWIQVSSVSIPSTEVGASAGLYLRTGNEWVALMSPR